MLHLNKDELKQALGFASIFLGFAHARGVTLGHFGNDDFVDIAAHATSGLYGMLETPAPAAQ